VTSTPGGTRCRPPLFAQKYPLENDFRLFFPQNYPTVSYLNKTHLSDEFLLFFDEKL